MEFDEGIRRGTTLEKMAGLSPLAEGGRLTAAVSSQISDAACAMLIAGEQAVADHGLKPRARFHHMSVRGADPIYMLTGPIPATEYALARTGMTIDDIDLFECNEAFASVVAGLDGRARCSPREGQRERWGHRFGPPTGGYRRPADDHPA